MDTPSFAHLSNLKFIEQLYESWIKDKESVDPSWRYFFEGMELASLLPRALPPRKESHDLRVSNLIAAYRTYGHLAARIDPLADGDPDPVSELKLENFAFTKGDLEGIFPTCGFLPKESAPLKEILSALEATYCGTIGVEYMSLGDMEIEKWIQKRIEPGFGPDLSKEEKIELLGQLNQAEGFEAFLHTKYVGQKRFSLEGEETMIPVLRAILESGAKKGLSDVVLGMSHRGRLNVLTNIMGKSYEYIFEEFEDRYSPESVDSSGDVKYHKGFAATYASGEGKKIQITLCANPSHLESVDPVVEGGARGIQEFKKSKEKRGEVLPILIHGDAAVAGQGVVYEVMGFAKLNGYGTRGTLHIVANNQIGFTTLPKDGRSTRYCTDIAKAFGAPVFHVNAEDPEACVKVARIATELRQTFGCDVFIDLIGYRKYGHNEGDEPSFTQPLQYQKIRSKKTIRQLFEEQLIKEGALDQKGAEKFEEDFKQKLNDALARVKSKPPQEGTRPVFPRPEHSAELLKPVSTAVEKNTLVQLAEAITGVPEGFNLNPKIQRQLKEHLERLEVGIDWGMGELLTYASLCTQGIHVRLSGQDVRRGTFSHRHAIWIDQVTSAHYFPLSHLKEGQARCDFFNSSLSEMAVLGFEFGYSLVVPQALVIWEAQFGDFNNGAQIIIDQYLATAEVKWGHKSNLTLLLPHGYEGQGPEHSSARIERFLQLACDDNMIVANCTTPAQLFHLLRRQALRPMKKPLIVFSPKALLRHPLCRSPLSDFSSGGFQEVIDDPTPAASTKKLVFCSGKIYYDLIQEREKRKAAEMTIIRIEQLYPLHEEKIKALRAKYRGTPYWVQEEHSNMGAWDFIRLALSDIPFKYVGRERSASPAAGSHTLHKLQYEAVMKNLFEGS